MVQKGSDVDPGNQPRVNESHQLARLDRGLNPETHYTHSQQIIWKLKIAEHLIAYVKTVTHGCRVIEVPQTTYHRWRQHYGGIRRRGPDG
jgi:hypothetical protein